MSRTPRVLWVTAEVPDRAGGSSAVRQHHLLARLADRFAIDLVVAGRVPDQGLSVRLHRAVEVEPAPERRRPAGRWARRLAQLTAGSRREPLAVAREAGTRERLERAMPRGPYDAVVLQHAALVPLLEHRDAAVWVVELHDAGSERAGHLAAVAGPARSRSRWRREARRARRLERFAAEHADLVVVRTEGDAERIVGPTVVVPDGVDPAAWDAAAARYAGALRAALSPTAHRSVAHASAVAAHE